MSATSLSLLLVGLFPLYISPYKPLIVTLSSAKAVITVIVSAKCLFTSRAASHYLTQSLLSVRSAQDELKPEKKRFLNVKKEMNLRCFELLCDESAVHCFVKFATL